MGYAYEQAPAKAGELGKGNFASAKTSAEKVTGKVKACLLYTSSPQHNQQARL